MTNGAMLGKTFNPIFPTFQHFTKPCLSGMLSIMLGARPRLLDETDHVFGADLAHIEEGVDIVQQTLCGLFI
jgi:hypothetical protein